jgi:MFS family permease
LGLAWNFLFVSGTALLPSTYRNEERFRVQGFNEFVVFGSQAVAALSSGWVLSTIGWQPLLLLCLPMVGVQLALLYVWRLSSNK